jgi:hypothetical protein
LIQEDIEKPIESDDETIVYGFYTGKNTTENVNLDVLPIDNNSSNNVFENFAYELLNEYPEAEFFYIKDTNDFNDLKFADSSCSNHVVTFFTEYDFPDDIEMMNSVAEELLQNWNNSMIYICYENGYIVRYSNVMEESV